MFEIKVIEDYDQIENIDHIIKLIGNQMKVVKGECNYDVLFESLKKVFAPDSRARLFILKDESEYMGFAFGNICSGLESGGNYFWVNELYIDESYRAKSLATKLLQFIEKWCENSSIKYIACVTGVTNEKAKRLYKKNEYDLNEIVWVDKALKT